MPVMDGFAATAEIRRVERELGQNSNIPIIALTASVLDQTKRKCMTVGMDDHLTKPIKPSLLYNALKIHLAKKGRLGR